MSFTATAQSEAPPSQAVLVYNPDGALFDFQVEIDGGSSGTPRPDWLRINSTRASTPGRLILGANTAGLAPGEYGPARVHITTSRGVEAAPSIPVTLRVIRAAPRLAVAPELLRFVVRPFGPNHEQALLVRNTGSGGLAAESVAVTPGAPWLRASVESCAEAACVVRVTAAFGGQAPGAYRAALRVTTEVGSRDVPVSLFVADRGPWLDVNPGAAQIEQRAGHSTKETRRIAVMNAGEGLLSWSAETVSGREWLSVSPAASGAPGTLELSANPSGLAPGAHYALVRVSSATAANSPQYVVVVLRVMESDAPPLPSFSQNGFLFSAMSGTAPADSEPLTLFTSNADAIPYYAAAQTGPQTTGTSWLVGGPLRATVSTGSPAPLLLNVVPGSLGPGVYAGLMVVSLGGNAHRAVNVTFVLRPPAREVCVPGQVAAVHTALPDNFETWAGVPAPLAIRVANDCGEPMTNAIALATFSNGGAAVPLRHVGGGVYAGDWAPRNTGPACVLARASVAGLKPVGAELIGTVRENRAPAVALGGVLNNLNPQPGAALAPGTIVQIFGSDLAGTSAQPPVSGGRLPMEWAGTSVLVGNSQAPLYFVSAGQINVQLPFELAPGRMYPLLVGSRGAWSLPETISVAAHQPAVAANPDGRAIAQDASFRLIDERNPARRGDYAVLYLVGLGATRPAVASGVLSPSQPPAEVLVPPRVSLDGQPAEVVWAGLAPGFVGLYQVNIRVPAGVGTGNLKLVVSQGGVEANVTTLAVSR